MPDTKPARRVAAVLALGAALAAPPALAQTRVVPGGMAARESRAPWQRASDADGWTLELAPYLWATGIEGDVALRGQSVHVDLGFGDLIKKVDGAFMLATEARKQRWGLGMELILFKLSDEAGTPGPMFSGVEVSVQQTFIELSPRYRIFEPDPVALDLILGARVWQLGEKLRFSRAVPPTLLLEASERWIDPFLGLRAIAPLGDRWLLQARGDIGGFSIGSVLTWQLLGLAGYRLGHSVTLLAGYRHLDVDFNDATSGFLFDVGLGGWIVGAVIRP